MRSFALLAAITCLLGACSSIHKVVTKDKKTVDSTVAASRDTSFKNVQITDTSNLQAWGIDIGVTYRGSDTLAGGQTPAQIALKVAKRRPTQRISGKMAPPQLYPANPRFVPSQRLDPVDARFVELLKDAIAASGTNGNIASVTIHIDSLTDDHSHNVSIDTGSAHAKVNTNVKTDNEHSIKTVQKTSPVWILYLGLLVILLIIVLSLLIRFKIIRL